MVCGLAANFVESDDQEQPPQLVLIGDVIIALADPPKEGAEHGLDNVFHTLPARARPSIASGPGYSAAGRSGDRVGSRHPRRPRGIARARHGRSARPPVTGGFPIVLAVLASRVIPPLGFPPDHYVNFRPPEVLTFRLPSNMLARGVSVTNSAFARDPGSLAAARSAPATKSSMRQLLGHHRLTSLLLTIACLNTLVNQFSFTSRFLMFSNQFRRDDGLGEASPSGISLAAPL